MKIAFLSFYSGQVERGVEVAAAALVKGLAGKHQTTLFQAGKTVDKSAATIIIEAEKKWPTDSSSSFLRVFYLDYYSLKILWFTLKFLPFFFKERYDVIIPMNGGWQILICRIISWVLGKKLLVQGNAGIGRDDFFQALCLPDHFVAISPNGFDWIRKKAPWLKTSYIPFGVDISALENTQTQNLTLPKPIVLCVSAFLPYKQTSLLIEAMKFVPEASLLVIGHGPLEQKLRTLGEKTLGKRFQLLTGITHEKLLGYYKAVDVFSLPSAATEALGIVYIEAMSAGLPIVAPDDMNRRLLIGDAGIFIDPKNTSQYAQAITQALRAKNISSKAIAQARKFDWSVIIAQYEKLIETI